MTRYKCVAVIGGRTCTQQEAESAEQVGALLGKRGVVVVCGGRGGVMEAACRGAQKAGGLTVGILPGSDPADGNSFLSLIFPTSLGHARNALVVQAGQVVIAIGGGYGTLSEIAFALSMKRPVIGIGTWEAYNRVFDADILYVDSAEDAVKHALHFLSVNPGDI